MMLKVQKKHLNFYGEEHDFQSHMQDKYCGDCYVIYLIQTANERKPQKRWLARLILEFVGSKCWFKIVSQYHVFSGPKL